MPLSHLRAIVATVRLDQRVRLACRQEREALARAGERLGSAPDPSAGLAPEARAEIQHLRGRIDGYAREIDRTREADRADYATVAGWARPAVVVRGLAARLVLRHQGAGARRALRPLHATLGAAALGLSAADRARLGVSEALGAAARAAAERERARAERTALLAPYGGSALPAWAGRAGLEAGTLARAVGRQVQGQLFPRASALAGLAAGWWVTNTYTDSHWRSALRSVGIGGGGTRVVSAETFRAMSFWVPILAAAVCAYLGDRLAAYVRRRYLHQPGATPSGSPE